MKSRTRTMSTVLGTGLLAAVAACDAAPTSTSQAASRVSAPDSFDAQIVEYLRRI